MRSIGVIADSSSVLGEGHAMRCIRLIEGLIEAGFLCKWYCDELTDRCEEILNNMRVEINPVSSVFKDENLAVIIDSYTFDAQTLRQKLSDKIKVLVFDDLANRYIDADVVIDGSPIRNKSDYKGLVPLGCDLLVGEKYIMLPKEYRTFKNTDVHGMNIHIFFGSSDPSGLTLEYLKKLHSILPLSMFHVVVTRLTKDVNKILNFSRRSNRIVAYYEPQTLKYSLEQCRFAIGAPGTTTWERLALDCKCLLFSTAGNQENILRELESKGIINYLGKASEINKAIFRLCKIIKNDFNFSRYIAVDGMGVIRVCDYIRGIVHD